MKLKIIYTILILIVLTVTAQEVQPNKIFTSPSILEISTQLASTTEEKLTIRTTVTTTLNIEISPQIKNILSTEETLDITANKQQEITLKIQTQNTQPGIYSGYISITDNKLAAYIPIIININPKKEILDLNLELPLKKLYTNDLLAGKLEIVNLGEFKPLKLTINSQIKDFEGNILESSTEIKVIDNQLLVPIRLTLPSIDKGNYYLQIDVTSDISSERISKSFTILEGQAIQQETPINSTRNLSILLIIISIIIIFLVAKKFTRKKSYILLFILLVIGIIISFNSFTPEDTKQPAFTVDNPSLEQNISQILGMSKLTNEPFLKNITEGFFVYVVENSKITKPQINIESSENAISITLGNAQLEISRLGKKYELFIHSQGQIPATCNLFCIWKHLFLKETIAILILIAVIILLKRKPKLHIKQKEENEQDRINNLILNLNLNKKDIFSTITTFFTQLIDLNYEATLEQLRKEISKTKFNKKIKDKIYILLDKLNDSEYSPENISKKEIKEDFKNIIIEIKEFCEKSYKHKDFSIKEVKQ